MENVLVSTKNKSTNVRTNHFKSALAKSFELLSSSKPYYFSKLTTELLFHPKYMENRPKYTLWSTKAKQAWLPIAISGHRIKTYKWGEGPAIILMHGWAGRGLQLYSFIQPLIDQGYSVIAFDAPAHGESTGFATNYFDFVTSLQTVIQSQEEVAGIIGHSMGCGAVLGNLAKFHSIPKAILIAPQYDMEQELSSWSEKSFIGIKAFKNILHYLEQKYQLSLEKLNSKNLLPDINTDILLIHDREDIPSHYSNSVKLDEKLPNSSLFLTTKLGHYKILRNTEVINKVAEFFKI